MSVQIDELGGEFIRPRPLVSHHDSNDNLAKKEREVSKQYSSLTDITKILQVRLNIRMQIFRRVVACMAAL